MEFVPKKYGASFFQQERMVVVMFFLSLQSITERRLLLNIISWLSTDLTIRTVTHRLLIVHIFLRKMFLLYAYILALLVVL